MDCPYVIRESIGFGRVREHGYYQLDEMAYDLTHDFADADVEVITRPTYNVTMESGEELSRLDDDTVFKMLSAGLPVKYVENARDGYIMYSRPESKPAVKVKRVGDIIRAHAAPCKAVKTAQYDTPIIVPVCNSTYPYVVSVIDQYGHVGLSWYDETEEAEVLRYFKDALKPWFVMATIWHRDVAIRKQIDGECL